MSTPAIINIGGTGIYSHYDGHVDHLGAAIVEFLKGVRITPESRGDEKQFLNIREVAAALVSHLMSKDDFKRGISLVHELPERDLKDSDIEYLYIVSVHRTLNTLRLSVYKRRLSYSVELVRANVDELDEACLARIQETANYL